MLVDFGKVRLSSVKEVDDWPYEAGAYRPSFYEPAFI
jgi:hypothetical protein